MIWRRLPALFFIVALLPALSGAGWLPLAKSGTASWSPLSDGGLLAWLEADSGTFTNAACTGPATNGQTIGCWADKSPNGYNHTNTVSTSQYPQYNTNQLNGLPTIAFTGANLDCLYTGAAQVSLGGTTASGFILAKKSAVANNSDRFLIYQANGQANDFGNTPSAIFEYAASNTNMSAFRNSSGLSNGAFTNNTYTQFGSVYDGTNNTVYIGGSAQSSSASSGSFGATGMLSVGCFNQSSSGNNMDGSVAAVYVTKSTNTAANIRTYWLNKWGL